MNTTAQCQGILFECEIMRLVSKITPRTLIESETGIIEPAMVGSVSIGSHVYVYWCFAIRWLRQALCQFPQKSVCGSRKDEDCG